MGNIRLETSTTQTQASIATAASKNRMRKSTSKSRNLNKRELILKKVDHWTRTRPLPPTVPQGVRPSNRLTLLPAVLQALISARGRLSTIALLATTSPLARTTLPTWFKALQTLKNPINHVKRHCSSRKSLHKACLPNRRPKHFRRKKN